MQVTSDYFAELYVAGLMTNAGWNIYFPHRDRGLDVIASKTGPDGVEIIRPVQIKGKYPTQEKTDKILYGYVGKLNQIHPEMVLGIPYFAANETGTALFVAYMPFSQIKKTTRGYRCQPASFKSGCPKPRRDSLRSPLYSTGLSLFSVSSFRVRPARTSDIPAIQGLVDPIVQRRILDIALS